MKNTEIIITARLIHTFGHGNHFKRCLTVSCNQPVVIGFYEPDLALANLIRKLHVNICGEKETPFMKQIKYCGFGSI